MLKVEDTSRFMWDSPMKNRLRVLDDELAKIVTHLENLAEAGFSISQDPFLGSPYESARMLQRMTKMLIEDEGCSYDWKEAYFHKLHAKVQAYVTLHDGLVIANSIPFPWRHMPDLLDLDKDISKVNHIQFRESLAGKPFTAEC